MQIEFLGAAREVTGSKHLITTDRGKRILLDCGMFQGKGMETDRMNRNLGFDAKKIDHIILTHAHIDHSGLIPYMYRLGFRGSVICTPATRDLCSIMLADTAYIQELDVRWFNKKQKRHRRRPIQPLYRIQDAEECMRLFITVDYERKFRIDEHISIRFSNSGHMLGSAVVSLEIEEGGRKKHIAYTGDIGRLHSNILCPPHPFPPCDYLICESTYGNSLHEDSNLSEQELLEVAEDTCVRKQGKLIIPSFSVGRTQDLLFVLNKLYNAGKLPDIPVYVDSPLSVNATQIFRLHTYGLNADVRRVMQTDPDPFGFNTLHYITDTDESKRLNTLQGPCIIISASGMAEAGRVKHHIANHIEDPTTTILIVGYCTPTSLGARLQEAGIKTISIFGEIHRVAAQVKKIDSFSGHGDYEEMRRYLCCQQPERLKGVFIVHGESDAAEAYKEHLREAGFCRIEIPAKGDRYDL